MIEYIKDRLQETVLCGTYPVTMSVETVGKGALQAHFEGHHQRPDDPSLGLCADGSTLTDSLSDDGCEPIVVLKSF